MGVARITRNDSIKVLNGIFKTDLLDLRNGWTNVQYGVGVEDILRYFKDGKFELAMRKSKELRKRLGVIRQEIESLEAIEAEHGKGCLLDLDNYFVQQIIAAGGLVEEQENAVRYRKAMAAPSSDDA